MYNEVMKNNTSVHPTVNDGIVMKIEKEYEM